MSIDSDLIRRSIESPAVFAEVYDRHAAVIHRYAARRIGESADDVLSETFLVAFEKRTKYDLTRPSALPWLFGIASVLIRKHRRQEALVWRAVEASQEEVVIDDHDERLDAQLAVRALGSAVRRMPARDRDVLLLYAWGDLDYDGVAVALGIPIGTVRSRLNRARRTLRESADRGIDPRAERAGESPETEVGHGRDDAAAEGA